MKMLMSYKRKRLGVAALDSLPGLDKRLGQYSQFFLDFPSGERLALRKLSYRETADFASEILERNIAVTVSSHKFHIIGF